jgi:hypothetical protein
MKLIELFTEGAVKRAVDNGTYHKPTKPVGKFRIAINGKPWGNFSTRDEAMKIATDLYRKNPKVRYDVVPA